MTTQTQQIVYWVGTELELFAGFCLLVAALWQWRTAGLKADSVLGAALSFVLPDVGMLVVFMPLHLFDLIRVWEKGEGGAVSPEWCTVCAFTTITCLCTLFCLSVLLAYATYRATRAKPLTQMEILAANVASWAIGAGVASAYAGQEVLGKYKGLYCCIRESAYKNFLVLPNFSFFAVCLGTMVYFYYLALQHVHEIESRVDNRRQGGGDSRANRMLIAVARHCAFFCVVFLAAWLLMMINGLLTFIHGGNGVHIWLDIAAAWSAKLQPALNSIVLMQLISKASNANRTPGNSNTPRNTAEQQRLGNTDTANNQGSQAASAAAATAPAVAASAPACGPPPATAASMELQVTSTASL